MALTAQGDKVGQVVGDAFVRKHAQRTDVMHVKRVTIGTLCGTTEATRAIAPKGKTTLPIPVVAIFPVETAAPVRIVSPGFVLRFPRMTAFARAKAGVPNAVLGNSIRGMALLTDTFYPRHGGSGALRAAKAAGVVRGDRGGKVERLATALTHALDLVPTHIGCLAFEGAKVVQVRSGPLIVGGLPKRLTALGASNVRHMVSILPLPKARLGTELVSRASQCPGPLVTRRATPITRYCWHKTSYHSKYTQITSGGK